MRKLTGAVALALVLTAIASATPAGPVARTHGGGGDPGGWPLTTSEPPLPRLAVPGDGFHWRRATTSAGATVGALLGGALVVTFRRRRRVPRPALRRYPFATYGRSI